MNGAWSTDDHSPPVQDEKILILAHVVSKFEKVMEEVGRIEGRRARGKAVDVGIHLTISGRHTTGFGIVLQAKVR